VVNRGSKEGKKIVVNKIWRRKKKDNEKKEQGKNVKRQKHDQFSRFGY